MQVLESPAKPQNPPSPKERPFIVFGKPDIGEAEIAAVSDVLRSSWLSTGSVVRTFEQEFAKHIGGGYAVAVNSATMGLMLSMAVAAIGDDKEIITTPLTFAATLNSILAMRVRPVMIDVDEHGNLDPDKLEDYLRYKMPKDSRVRGILPVHMYGAACNMQVIMNMAGLYDLRVIEDAAHAFDGYYVGPSDKPGVPGPRRQIGTIGDFSVFSFYPNKNITSAEGGMVVTKRGEWAERLRGLTNHGMTANSWDRYGSGPIRNYEVAYPGYKGNMSDVHAAIGLTQLRRWPEMKIKRAKIWNIYEDAFGWKEPGHSQHLFTIRVKNRDIFRTRMHEAGIGTGIHYRPLHLEPAYYFLGYKAGDFPIAEKIGAETVSLPISATMSEDDARYVADTAKRIKEEVDNGRI